MIKNILYIFGLVLILNGCKSHESFYNSSNKNLSVDIVDYLIKKKIISNENRAFFLKDFDEYITINELIHNNAIICDGGIYELSANITHTVSFIILFKNKNEFFLIDLDNYNGDLKIILGFINSKKGINKKDCLKYLRRVTEIKENNDYTNKNLIIH